MPATHIYIDSPHTTPQHVWGLRYVDDLILRDGDADNDPETGNYGHSGSGLEQRVYVLQDANWNVTALVSTSGVVLERFVYDAYGNGKVLSDAFGETSDAYSWDYRFSGRERDSATGIYYLRRRWYDPDTGTPISRDPRGFAAGDANLYRYCSSNPINATDPSGLEEWHEATGGGTWDPMKPASQCVAMAAPVFGDPFCGLCGTLAASMFGPLAGATAAQPQGRRTKILT